MKDQSENDPQSDSQAEAPKEVNSESRTYLGMVINTIGNPIFVKDDQSKLILVNDAFCEIFGLERQDIIGKTLAEDVSPIERESFLKIDKQVLAEGVEIINEETLTVRGGEALRIATRKSRFIDSDGEKFLVGLIHDITERYNVEQGLKIAKERAGEYQERFRLLTLNMEAGVVIHAPDTSIVQNNERASILLGLSNDQLRGKTAIDPDWKFVNLDKSPLPLEEYPVNRILNSKQSIKNQIVGLRRPDLDHVMWFTVNGFSVQDSDGEMKEIVTIFIDITEQKKNKEEKQRAKLRLESTEKQLNDAQKLAGVGSWVFNPFTDDVAWSDQMFQIWGFDPKRGTPRYDPVILKRIHPDDLELTIRSMDAAIKHGTPYDIEFRLCIPDEEQKVVRSICEPELGELDEVISLSGTSQDITVQKLFEDAQAKHQRLKAIGEMSSSIAHDFNNALQEMMGNLEVVKMQKDLSENSLERLKNIGSIIMDAAGRVSALQRFGDAENNDENRVFVDFNELINECLDQSRPLWKDQMEKEGFRIVVETRFEPVPKIKCNSGEMKSTVYNLIKNSIEAMPKGGELTIKTGTKGRRIFATFSDTGSGMDEEAKLKIFEPFFTTKGFQLGRGLGMSGAYNIVKKLGGNISIKSSEPQKGTTIRMTLPFSSEEEVIDQHIETPKDKVVFKVLWVDDDFLITKSSQLLVESLGYSCKSVNSGKKALEYLEQNPCDIVFTDIGMPKMNGWELAEAIRAEFGDNIKIVAVTGWNVKEQVQEGNSVDFFLQKPFALPDLKNIFMLVSGV